MSTSTSANGTAATLPPEQREAVKRLGKLWRLLRGQRVRQQAALALAGGLLRAGWPVPEVESFLLAVAEAGEDEEADRRVAAVQSTAAKIAAGQAATGWPALVKLLRRFGDGDIIVQDLLTRLGIGRGEIVATYDYRDGNGVLLYQVVRYAPKDFRQRRPDGRGGWVWRLGSVQRVLYRLPELLAAAYSKTVFIPEGEKDVDNLVALGLTATCNVGGAGKWRSDYSEFLRGRPVVILPDADDPGRDHARQVADALSGIAASVRVLEIPGLGAETDVSDWLEAGGTVEQLVSMAAAVPEWRPATGPAEVPTPEPTLWPDPPGEEAFSGLAGRIVRAIEPASEADPTALLLQLLIAFGNAVGRAAYFTVEADTHYSNEFVVLIGRTSKARKGSSWAWARRLFREVDEKWASERIVSGLSSGEGLIWVVRDPIMGREKVKEKNKPVRYEEVVVDPGVSDKRALVMEPEFASVLRQLERQGNTLSVQLRLAWDGLDLRSLTKNSPAKATGAHISLIGHITVEELRRYLTVTETANGFGNRFLPICADRSKFLPFGGRVDPAVWAELRNELTGALAFARSAGEVQLDEQARALWQEVYAPLSAGKPGLAGALLARAEAHVLRLAMLYALLDRSAVIGPPHLLAALALWDYCERSVYFVFGDSLGDPVADELLRLLRNCPSGLTRTEIRDYFQRNASAERIGRALGLLLQLRLARREQQDTGGRPSERWFAAGR
jgi:hypothetical protein